MSAPRSGLGDKVPSRFALFNPLIRQNVGYKNIMTT